MDFGSSENPMSCYKSMYSCRRFETVFFSLTCSHCQYYFLNVLRTGLRIMLVWVTSYPYNTLKKPSTSGFAFANVTKWLNTIIFHIWTSHSYKEIFIPKCWHWAQIFKKYNSLIILDWKLYSLTYILVHLWSLGCPHMNNI